MADRPVIALAAAILEIEEFRTAKLLDDFTDDRETLKSFPSLDLRACAVKENLGKCDLGARSTVEFFHFDHVASGDAVLFAAGFENCVCHKGRFLKKERETATPDMG